MENERFCCCGTQRSYPHRPNCPYPYFGNEEDEINEWKDAYYRLAKKTPRWNHLPQQQGDENEN